MMEIGKHCSYSLCERLDFLPYTCNKCQKCFCQDHWKSEDHKCPFNYAKTVIECPICNQILKPKEGQDANTTVSEHIDKNCPRESSTNKEITKKFSCSYNNCKTKELQKCVCNHCNFNYCLRHRAVGDHNCPKSPSVRASITGISSNSNNNNNNNNNDGWSLSQILSDSKKKIEETFFNISNSTTNPTARKYALIKMKQNAIGKSTVPAQKRFYLEINYPKETNKESQMFFFDESQRYGNVLDQVTDHAKIKNENNISGKRKLVFVSLRNMESIPLNEQLKESSKFGVSSTDAIILEYEDVITKG
eukprot:TRINITY_DN2150_c0_g1_i1.p1 TRINITY_DN2150_c0_g1~~TRINITY_DN2150_c0_g1_i1.p1  ORF type:complete len:305 (-),score=44.53 TRINITY_DN2150_c0_g1_i1:148-1062(-)